MLAWRDSICERYYVVLDICVAERDDDDDDDDDKFLTI